VLRKSAIKTGVGCYGNIGDCMGGATVLLFSRTVEADYSLEFISGVLGVSWTLLYLCWRG
jgi:hypothetical protein